MILVGCALWLGEGKPEQYWNGIRSFLSTNKKDARVNIFFSKNKCNLPQYLNERYTSDKKTFPEYETLIDRIYFFDIDTQSDKYVQWLDQFEPTPYPFISDYLRFAALSHLAAREDNNNNRLIVFFELDVEFKKSIESIKDQLESDTVLLPEYESSLYVIFVNQPGKYAKHLLNSAVKIYLDLYDKILVHLDVQNKPESLNVLENEKYVTEMLGMSLEAPSKAEEKALKETKGPDIKPGFVNLRGFFSVIQALAKDVMQSVDEESAEQSLYEVKVEKLIEHFPSSKQYVYGESSYKLKAISADIALNPPNSERSRPHFFSEPTESKKRKREKQREKQEVANSKSF